MISHLCQTQNIEIVTCFPTVKFLVTAKVKGGSMKGMIQAELSNWPLGEALGKSMILLKHPQQIMQC